MTTATIRKTSDAAVVIETAKRKSFYRKKSCPFSGPKALPLDYKLTNILRKFISDKGRILPSRITGVSAKMQRRLAKEIKIARQLGLLPFVSDQN